MGNVLVDFTPHRFCAEVSNNIDEINDLAKGIFYTQAWLDLDEGIISEDECLFEILKNFELDKHELVKKIFYSWDEWMHEKIGMTEIVESLKGKGYQLILLSNAAIRYHRYIHRLPVFSLFDHLIYSCDLKLIKPDPAFFEKVLLDYQLKSEEIFYVDDSYANIKTASDLGFHCYHFIGDVESFKETLIKINLL